METYQYETEALGFTPLSFVDGVINAVNDYACDGVDQLRAALLQDAVRFADKEWTCKAMDAVLEHIQASIDRNFDKFELYVLKNIFRLPSHVVLPWDEKVLSMSDITVGDETILDEELRNLRTKCRKLRRENADLRRENEIIKPMKLKVEEASKMLETFAAASKKADVPMATLSETFECLCGQAAELQAVISTAALLARKRPAAQSEKDETTLDQEYRAKRQRLETPASRDLKALLKLL